MWKRINIIFITALFVFNRYRQVGNAVAVPVAKALGYALGMASQRLIGKEPLLTLPPKFAYSNHL